jgi:ATP-dependent Lhr-like helicase
MVATASLELGIDIGSIDLVVQLGSPRSIAVMLQRLGRSGHHKAAVSKGLLLATSRDELVECVALLRAISEHTLDAVRLPNKPLDVLAQQLVAEVAAQDWPVDALFELVRRAMPYEALTRNEFDQVLHLVSEGVATSRGRSRVHLHHDRVNGVVRARRGARLMALQNGGAIPDLFTYAVIAEPDEKQVGTVDEDFAVESMAGDIFVLGSTSWLIRRISEGKVRVENANGRAPSVPFWRGEAPARTDELSAEVSRLREDVATREDVVPWLTEQLGLAPHAAELLVRYVRVAGAPPWAFRRPERPRGRERFFDEAGGMQLIHARAVRSPHQSRVGYGLAQVVSAEPSTSSCRLPRATTAILLSLGEQHSFPLARHLRLRLAGVG